MTDFIKPRVFVTHEPQMRVTDPTNNTISWVRSRDLSAAHEYGEMRYVFPAGRLTQDPAYLVATAREKLSDFTSNDFLLLSGDTAAMAICSIIAAQRIEMGENKIRFLLWDKRLANYYIMAPEVWLPDNENTMDEDGQIQF